MVVESATLTMVTGCACSARLKVVGPGHVSSRHIVVTKQELEDWLVLNVTAAKPIGGILPLRAEIFAVTERGSGFAFGQDPTPASSLAARSFDARADISTQ
jgi:hypothetical protein